MSKRQKNIRRNFMELKVCQWKRKWEKKKKRLNKRRTGSKKRIWDLNIC